MIANQPPDNHADDYAIPDEPPGNHQRFYNHYLLDLKSTPLTIDIYEIGCGNIPGYGAPVTWCLAMIEPVSEALPGDRFSGKSLSVRVAVTVIVA
ncbi:hypothetical protein M1N87_00085 [Dehalococcoidia bacterium]|nr:hypothetical protein [Dehalococcoidia bacterium]MCL0073693.1 hypothetical protein [Dehalococcoidia bacterium]MCL0088205.1 hypothetical protein [Dehalococcoidia bacterium]MCL0088221.1 hypothetical protein [Dehalococcoidia bacterium]